MILLGGLVHCPRLLPEVQDSLLLAAVKRRWRSRHCCFQLFPWLPPPQSPDKLPSSSRPSLPPGTGGVHQRCLSLEYPFASQVGVGPKVGFILEEDLGSTLLGLLSDLAVLEDEAQPMEVVQATAPTQPQVKALLEKLPYYFPVPVGQFNPRLPRRILHRRLQLVLLTSVQDGGEPPVCSKTKPWAPPWRKLSSHFPMV